MNNSTRLKWALMYLCSAVLLTGACRAESPQSLYERMGGSATVKAIVSEVIDEASHDPLLRNTFAEVNLPRLKGMLSDEICQVAGGGCKYTGDNMHDAHAGLAINQAEFYHLVQLWRDSMVRHGVGLRERNELLKILAPMKRDIVEK